MNRTLRLTSLALTLGLMAVAPGCLDRPIGLIEPDPSPRFTERLQHNSIDKIDILLAVDDSGSMGDKQQILAEVVPSMVTELVNPPCIDANGALVLRPDNGFEACPEGSFREHQPVHDVHIAVVNTSLPLREIGGYRLV